jgi:TRAP-type C4-dicarboxylate transport system substrate-binding protein
MMARMSRPALMRIVRGLGVCLLVASTALATSCGGRPGLDKAGAKPAAPVVLKLANHEHGPDDLQAWIDAVQRLSNGSIRIHVVNNWREVDRGLERRTIGDVRSGRIALAKVPARAYDTVGVTTFQPLVAPFLIDSSALMGRVLTSPLAKHALAGTAALGLTGLAILPGELRRQIGVSRPLMRASDFRGARIAVREGQVEAATYRALGADPIELPPGSSLASVDGTELPFEVLADNPSAGDVRALAANVVLWPKPMTIVINADRFASLTRRQQHALRDAGPVAFAAQMKVVSERDDDALRRLCRIATPFVRAQPSELAALRAAVQPVYGQIERGAGNAAALREILAMKGDAAPDAPACRHGDKPAATPDGQATALDGTYRTSFSKRELADSPDLMGAGEINDQNWGVLTVHLTHGRMTVKAQNSHGSGTDTGRYTVNGDTIRFNSDQTGETFAFRWNLYRDTLKFQRDETLGVGPTPFLVKPWRRVGP